MTTLTIDQKTQYCIDPYRPFSSITPINKFMKLHHLKSVLSDLVTLRTPVDFVIVLAFSTLFFSTIIIPMIDTLTK